MGIPNFNPEVIKKEARLSDDAGFDEGQEFDVEYILRLSNLSEE